MKINLEMPKLSIEEQLKEYSGTSKCGLFFFTPEGEMVSFWTGLTYMEKLFVIDSLQKRLDYDSRLLVSNDGEDEDDQ